MEMIKENFKYLYDFYLRSLEHADKRVENWFLMNSYAPTLALSMVYLLIVQIGPRFMASRKPFELRSILFIYNISLVLLNLHIFLELFINTTKLKYSYSCQPVHYGDDENELRIAKALWWFYFSKCLEFIDTFLFILRKKNNQVSFLHVYHHATMFPIWWIGVKWVPGGQSFFGAMVNSFIHVIMYFYYGISALGPKYQKYLWWKRYLTKIQLIQFVAGMVHAIQSLIFGCKFPSWMQWALIFYGMSILSLFLNFYFHAYLKPKKDKENAQATNGIHDHRRKKIN